MGARILVVEDEEALTTLLRYNLDAEGYDVETVARGDEADTRLKERIPDLVILDWMLPGLYGLEVCRRLRAASDVPILMLTAKDDIKDRVQGLDAGADDYLVKPFSLRELISRVRALLRRAYGELAAPAPDQRLVFGPLTIDMGRLLALRDGQPVELTPMEFRLLRYLASNPGRPFSRQQLIEAVWGYDSEVGSDRTVDVHMRHLRQKLEADPTAPRWLLTVRGVGYKFEP